MKVLTCLAGPLGVFEYNQGIKVTPIYILLRERATDDSRVNTTKLGYAPTIPEIALISVVEKFKVLP